MTIIALHSTKRVPNDLETNLLLLEGDQDGYLYLEGDVLDSDHDHLALDGDQAESLGKTERVSGEITPNITKRVA